MGRTRRKSPKKIAKRVFLRGVFFWQLLPQSLKIIFEINFRLRFVRGKKGNDAQLILHTCCAFCLPKKKKKIIIVVVVQLIFLGNAAWKDRSLCLSFWQNNNNNKDFFGIALSPPPTPPKKATSHSNYCRARPDSRHGKSITGCCFFLCSLHQLNNHKPLRKHNVTCDKVVFEVC